jgi:hypothetical protein
MARTYLIANGAMPTTAAIAPVTTGTAIKTMLQVQAASTVPFIVIGWGVSFTTTPTVFVTCELVDTFLIAATVTAHVAAGVMPMGADQTASTVALGTTATGYTCPTTEGSTVATRYGDVQQVLASQYFPLSPLGREFYVPGSHNLRVRMTTATAVLATCFVLIEE